LKYGHELLTFNQLNVTLIYTFCIFVKLILPTGLNDN